MEWYYARDDKQCGPVTETQLTELLNARKIDRDTLVWRTGMAEWQPLSEVRPMATITSLPPVIPTPAAASAQCVECRGVFSQSEMLFLNKCWVCGACKPIFLQRLAEGAAVPLAAGGLWRSGKHLVTRSETPMPDRCVKCNAPANGFRLKRQLWWHHPAIYILVLVSILIYAIVALIVRKKAVLHIGLCEAHRSQRRWTIVGCWLAALVGLAGIFAGFGGASWVVVVCGIGLLLAALVVGAVRGPVVSATKIENDIVRVRGVGPDYLNSLPEWND